MEAAPAARAWRRDREIGGVDVESEIEEGGYGGSTGKDAHQEKVCGK
jgi:hypothetical protein